MIKFERLARDIDVLGRTVMGEASGEPWDGKLAIGHVVLNRLAQPSWWSRQPNDNIEDDTIEAVCMDPLQFSCWNDKPENKKYRDMLLRLTLATDSRFRECYAAAAAVASGESQDNVFGADHYFADYIVPPKWSKGRDPVTVIGRHIFFKIGPK